MSSWGPLIPDDRGTAIGQSVTAITAGEPAILDAATTVREQSRRQQMGAVS